MAKGKTAADHELAAMASILTALDGLDGEAIQRVFDYVVGRLSINSVRLSTSASSIVVSSATHPEQGRARKPSVRDLREEKQPETASQMAALVAYYLKEVAEGEEAKPTVNTSDLEKYFKQAGFKLPKSMASTLPNATAAGYFEGVGNGQYRLNAVGYNLIAHGLPRSSSSLPKKKTRAKKTKR